MLSSNQVFTKQPTTIHITNATSKDHPPDQPPFNPPFNITAHLDYRTPIITQAISISIEQINIPGFTLYESGKNQLKLKKALLDLTADLKLNGNQLEGQVSAVANNIRYDKGTINAAFSVPYLLYQTLIKLKETSFTSTIKGTVAQPKIVVSSPIDKQFSGIIRLVARKALESKKEAIRSEIDAIVLQEKELLNAKLPNEGDVAQLDKITHRASAIKETMLVTKHSIEEKYSDQLNEVKEEVTEKFKSLF